MNRLRSALFTTAVAAALVLTSCTGDDEEPARNDDARSPAEVLAAAKAELDGTAGVRVLLETGDLPDGIAGVTKAEGVANHQPAFQGTIDAVISGFEGSVEVIAVDDEVYAVLPFGRDFTPIDPADFGAPDPAVLLDPGSGISNWLVTSTGMKQGDAVREGGDVLTSYEGTLPGPEVAKVLPSADEQGSFAVTYAIDQDGRLRTADLTGPFYSGEDDVTYRVTLSDYGTEQEIAAP